jgi:nicotinamide-nucleotide adenylyltransferase
VLDSSFNPPTTAHADMVRSALASADRATTGATRVLLLLAVNNADKAPKPASFPLRLAMMEEFGRALLLRDEGVGTEVDVDVGATTMAYFHDKARAILQSGFYGAGDAVGRPQPQPEMVFLAGFDTLIRIFNPKYYPSGMQASLGPFFEHARLRVTMRTDGEWGGRAQQEAYLRDLREGQILEQVGGQKAWAERVDLVEGLLSEEDGVGGISSSTVRDAVRRGDWERVRTMTGEEVMGWIRREDLYKENE